MSRVSHFLFPSSIQVSKEWCHLLGLFAVLGILHFLSRKEAMNWCSWSLHTAPVCIWCSQNLSKALTCGKCFALVSRMDADFFFLFLTAPDGIWDLSSLTSDWTCAPLGWECGILPTGPQGKSCFLFFWEFQYYFIADLIGRPNPWGPSPYRLGIVLLPHLYNNSVGHIIFTSGWVAMIALGRQVAWVSPWFRQSFIFSNINKRIICPASCYFPEVPWE